jgi:stalled ribosome rescue protein Dom34
MQYELEIITDISLSSSKTKKIIKNNKIKKLFDLNVVSLEEYVDPRSGKTISKYSGIYQDSVYYKINKPYEELKDLIINKTTPVLGFMSKSKIYRDGQKKITKS